MISGDYLCGSFGVSLGYDFLHFADLDFEILTRAILKEDGRFYIGAEDGPPRSSTTDQVAARLLRRPGRVRLEPLRASCSWRGGRGCLIVSGHGEHGLALRRGGHSGRAAIHE